MDMSGLCFILKMSGYDCLIRTYSGSGTKHHGEYRRRILDMIGLHGMTCYVTATSGNIWYRRLDYILHYKPGASALNGMTGNAHFWISLLWKACGKTHSRSATRAIMRVWGASNDLTPRLHGVFMPSRFTRGWHKSGRLRTGCSAMCVSNGTIHMTDWSTTWSIRPSAIVSTVEDSFSQKFNRLPTVRRWSAVISAVLCRCYMLSVHSSLSSRMNFGSWMTSIRLNGTRSKSLWPALSRYMHIRAVLRTPSRRSTMRSTTAVLMLHDSLQSSALLSTRTLIVDWRMIRNMLTFSRIFVGRFMGCVARNGYCLVCLKTLSGPRRDVANWSRTKSLHASAMREYKNELHDLYEYDRLSSYTYFQATDVQGTYNRLLKIWGRRWVMTPMLCLWTVWQFAQWENLSGLWRGFASWVDRWRGGRPAMRDMVGCQGEVLLWPVRSQTSSWRIPPFWLRCFETEGTPAGQHWKSAPWSCATPFSGCVAMWSFLCIGAPTGTGVYDKCEYLAYPLCTMDVGATGSLSTSLFSRVVWRTFC